MRYSISIHLDNEERDELRKLVRNHRFGYQNGAWKGMTENELKYAIVYCVVSTGTRGDLVERFHRARETKKLWDRPRREIERLLRKFEIRFPVKKSKWIASLRRVEVRPHLEKVSGLSDDTVTSAREARALLRKSLKVKGLGDKQLSHLLTKWLGFTQDLVPLDSRWDNFFQERGVFGEYDEPRYTLLEDLVIALASELRVSPAHLDDAVWYVMEEK